MAVVILLASFRSMIANAAVAAVQVSPSAITPHSRIRSVYLQDNKAHILSGRNIACRITELSHVTTPFQLCLMHWQQIRLWLAVPHGMTSMVESIVPLLRLPITCRLNAAKDFGLLISGA
jgi:hypothetical protein